MTPPRLTRIARTLRKHDTWAERLLWRWLRGRRFAGYKFRRQHPFGDHVLDFFCAEAWLNLELDGAWHGFPEQRERDARRDAELERKGVRVLRFWNGDLRRNARGLQDLIWQTLHERAPHPAEPDPPFRARDGLPDEERAEGGGDTGREFTRWPPSPRPPPRVRGSRPGTRKDSSR